MISIFLTDGSKGSVTSSAPSASGSVLQSRVTVVAKPLVLPEEDRFPKCRVYCDIANTEEKPAIANESHCGAVTVEWFSCGGGLLPRCGKILFKFCCWQRLGRNAFSAELKEKGSTQSAARIEQTHTTGECLCELSAIKCCQGCASEKQSQLTRRQNHMA